MVGQGGWGISDAKSGQRWAIDVTPSITLPPELGHGGVQLLGMHGGFQFCSLDVQMRRSSQIFLTDPSEPEHRVSLMLMASLRGTLGVKPGGFARPLHIPEATVMVCHVPEPSMAVEIPPLCQRGLDIGFSRKLLRQVAEDTPLPGVIRRLAEGGAVRPFSFAGRLNQRLGILIDDVLNNPYRGGASRLYQEAKGLEMIAVLVDALEARKSRRYTRWKRRDIELLQTAKTRLVSSLENPPTLTELSQSLGMSPTKLKRGFREVFGTTVTDTVRDTRLELARQLLEAGDLPLKAIAAQCGFCDASSLSHAFQRRYGRSPGGFRRS